MLYFPELCPYEVIPRDHYQQVLFLGYQYKTVEHYLDKDLVLDTMLSVSTLFKIPNMETPLEN